MAKPNVSKQSVLAWDEFVDKKVDVALPLIYAHTQQYPKQARDWYWRSIGLKRRMSMLARFLAFFLVLAGVVGPMIAAVLAQAETKLLLTQCGVAAIALAGVAQLGDKVFGLSSGWIRYISTVTAMEGLTLQFELDWAAHMITKAGELNEDDKKTLFDLARTYELAIYKCQTDETGSWVAEFNSGTAALTDMIKIQKDATEQAVKATQAQAEARAAKVKKGAIEVHITQQADIKPVTIFLDDDEKGQFKGSSWVAHDVAPGLHRVRAVLDDGAPVPFEATKSVEVTAGAATTVELKL